MRRALLALALVGAPLAAGCRDLPASSPEEAYLRLLKACNDDDGGLLFDSLDTETQWSIESVHHAQRRMQRLIVESYPPSEHERALGRLPPAVAEAEEHPRRYFRRLPGVSERLAEIKHRLYAGKGQPVGNVQKVAGTADVWREGGSVFRFARDSKGRWGFAELRAEWEQAKVRALHDEETVAKNAELYRQRGRPQ